MICLHRILKCPQGFWSQKPVSFQTLLGRLSTECVLKESVAHAVCQSLCWPCSRSPTTLTPSDLGDSCVNNIHPTFLLVFFCFAESRQLKRVCLGMGAVQVLLRICPYASTARCLAGTSAQVTSKCLPVWQANSSIDMNLAKSFTTLPHLVGPAQKEGLDWFERSFSLLQHLW